MRMKTNILIQRRKLLGYSQQDVADKVGIDRSYYTKIENGLTPSVKVAKAIGHHLGFDWTIFFEDDCVNIAQNRSKEAI
jgi:putative transcriptional regulator